ncbi:uncharacterized protein LOC127751923, partial [Frankliniella occidentalis]|uniref:Uncharacterized protein LOC127751923 n=1 Tax=Frankliniella occidentalis TaxID=133901 RepID=A0A9C6XAS2_FRAOC
MDHLPDDALVEVMQYLDVPDLLSCRLVCKRLAALALHRDAWRHRQLACSDRWMCVALRLAPCLDKAELQLPLSGRLMIATTTTCAVAELKLTMDCAVFGAMQAAVLTRHQASLGRLKRLSLVFSEEDTSLCPTLLFWMVASTSGLESLEIPVFPFYFDLSTESRYLPDRPVSSPSLEIFRCGFHRKSASFVHFILAEHADTLKDVSIPTLTSPSDPLTASLLANIPNLSRLMCPLIPGLDALAERVKQSLCWVHLCVSSLMRPFVPAAADFLRRAEDLWAVTLTIDEAGDVALQLVEAMVSSGESEVRVLSLRGSHCRSLAALQQIVDKLTSMPYLRVLKLQGPRGPDSPRCVHALLHWVSLQKLMNENHRMRLFARDDLPRYCQGAPCDSCKKTCCTATWLTECAVFMTRLIDDEDDCCN